ncbi:MAG: conjugative transposon protein TraN [Cyclobacteriaceae bacterium]
MIHFLNILYFRILLAFFLMLLVINGNGQANVQLSNVEVTFNKTSSIVFPAIITSVDRGSPDVLAQKARGVNNVLQLKAGKMNFKETNLTVITADGNLHHFLVQYSDHPLTFTYQATQSGKINRSKLSHPLIFQSGMTTSEMHIYCQVIIDQQERGGLKSTSKYDMNLGLRGIYIEDNIMFFHFKVANRSNIPYHTDMLRFFVKDKQKISRTASQEVEKIPSYRFGNDRIFEGRTTRDIVYAIPKFTIPDAKLLVIELIEKDGGRHLRLAVKNRKIMKAQTVRIP